MRFARPLLILLVAFQASLAFGQCNCWAPDPGGNPDAEPTDCGPSPILVDVSGNGIRLTSAANGVVFDIRADGHPIQIAWTSGLGAAFLFLDRNGNGTVDSGAELFGNYTPQPRSASPNGFLALAEYDRAVNGGNADGIIDARDSVFSSLRLWVDANHNGISESGELFTLPALGVNSISLSYKLSAHADRYGNHFRYRAKINPDSSGRDNPGTPWAWDVFFSTDVTVAVNSRPNDAPGTIKGSEHPEQIPTEVAFNIFLRVASCPGNATALQIKKCALVRRAVGLRVDDQDRLVADLAAFSAAVRPLDEQLVALHGLNDEASRNLRGSLLAQRRDLHKARAASLRANLSPLGTQQLDAYIQAMKSKIKIIPQSVGQ